jgi:hypothetical protein
MARRPMLTQAREIGGDRNHFFSQSASIIVSYGLIPHFNFPSKAFASRIVGDKVVDAVHNRNREPAPAIPTGHDCSASGAQKRLFTDFVRERMTENRRFFHVLLFDKLSVLL